MGLVVIGCSFRTAPLAIREKLALAQVDQQVAVARLCESAALQEGLFLSTCNRVEVYAVASDDAEPEAAIKQFLCQLSSIEYDDLAPSLYFFEGEAALRHIFRVASSLDAMVVGEPQITGQVKQAFATAITAGTVGSELSQVMQQSFAVSKRIRRETEISRHPASVSSVAVDLARRIHGDLSEIAVLVIGAGEMAEQAVRNLLAEGVSRLRVANRSLAKAERLAEEFDCKAVPLEELDQWLRWADVVVTSTGSQEPILTRAALGQTMRERKRRALYLLDIAVPRDVEESARSLANLYLFSMDDLERAVAENLKSRRHAAKGAEKIASAEVKRFRERLRRQGAAPVITLLREHFSTIARQEADRACQTLKLNGSQQRQALSKMADAIVNKLLHEPMMELKHSADRPDGAALLQATRRLFGLVKSDNEASKE